LKRQGLFMKHLYIAGLLLLTTNSLYGAPPGSGSGVEVSQDALVSALQQKQWIHGAADCDSNTDPAIEVFRYDESSYILRQNKCLNFEAPFIYVLVGDDTVLVLDTGATESSADFPLYGTVQALIEEQPGQTEKPVRDILVVHSHSHSDHYAGDSQFQGKPKVTLIAPNEAAITQYFGFARWPDGEARVDLGNRTLTIIPTPGHQEEALTVYDAQTKWLLTGDTLYPGYIYVKHWDEYKQSIARLASFSNSHPVSAVLGAHIEMTAQGREYYPIGTLYQPDEASLVLTPHTLLSLDAALTELAEPEKITMSEFIVAPMSTLQRTISNIARWITQ